MHDLATLNTLFLILTVPSFIMIVFSKTDKKSKLWAKLSFLPLIAAYAYLLFVCIVIISSPIFPTFNGCIVVTEKIRLAFELFLWLWCCLAVLACIFLVVCALYRKERFKKLLTVLLLWWGLLFSFYSISRYLQNICNDENKRLHQAYLAEKESERSIQQGSETQ